MSLTPDNYPPAPDHVPPDITTPSRSYRVRVLVVSAHWSGEKVDA
jgi:hypothetical protein